MSWLWVILLEVSAGEEYSHIALRNVLDKYQYLEKQERAFLTRLVEGTLERRIELDYIIDQFSSVKVKKQKPVIREILQDVGLSAQIHGQRAGFCGLQRGGKAGPEKGLPAAEGLCERCAT